MRANGRSNDSLRPIKITPHFINHPEGSVLIEVGYTKIICNATIENRVPPFLRGQNKGWITAEYSMLPRATAQRNIRESSRGKVSGRTMEIQRLIGRALRSVVNLEAIGERTIWLDCDVIQADGGTRTASISGAFVALVLACEKFVEEGIFETLPINDFLGAVSVGVLEDSGTLLDLDYEEDSQANVDMNVVMTSSGQFIELQGTGEEATFSKDELNDMLSLAEAGIEQIFSIQKDILGSVSEQVGKLKEDDEESAKE